MARGRRPRADRARLAGQAEAIAAAAYARMRVLPPPDTIDDLRVFARELYQAFESQAAFVRAVLPTDVASRMRAGLAQERWRRIAGLVDGWAPRRAPRERRMATAMIRCYLSATTWRFHRFHFESTLAESIAAAETAVRLALDDLR